MRRCLVVFSFFCLSSSLHAADPVSIGQVIWAKGTVKAAQPNQAARPLQRRTALYEHDVITTDNTGSGEIAFSDSSVVSLREGTEFKIDAYKFKQGGPPADDKSVMSVVKGGFRTITGVIPKENPDGYSMNTPVATIGVRGTDYSLFIDPVKGLLVDVTSGSILVKNAAGTLALSKAVGQAYAAVSGISAKPTLLASKPAIFNSQPAAAPAAPGVIKSIGAPAGGKAGGGSAPAKSLCIG